MQTDYQTFISLVRLGLGNTPECLSRHIDWAIVKEIAGKHGLSAIVLDGVDKLPEGLRPSRVDILRWIGEVIQGYETRYKDCEKVLSEMAAFYNAHGLKMMVLKGYACSLDWPRPEHRPAGDIDIWQFGEYQKGDALIASEKGIKVDSSHHHHTVSYWDDWMVENHYDFINVHHHKSNAEFEVLLKELGKDDAHFTEINGARVYLPSPNLHALFLLKHTMMHFASEGIMLRQLLDWGFHIKAHTKEIDWVWLERVLEQYGMKDLYNVFNAICVDDLGFDSVIFHQVQFNPELKEKVLKEILNPEYGADFPKGTLPRVIFKIRRWRSNAWKHKLCYKESMWSAFWSGIWNHLLKPSSI